MVVEKKPCNLHSLVFSVYNVLFSFAVHSDVKSRSLGFDIDTAGSDISSNGEEKKNSALMSLRI